MSDSIRMSSILEAMSHDYANNVNIYDLKIKQELKDLRWRLPSPEELRLILEFHKQGHGNFSSSWYMTNKSEGGFNNLEIHLGTGNEEDFDTSESHWGCCCVRLVRNIL